MSQFSNPIPAHLVFRGTINQVNLCIYLGNIFNVDAEIIVNPANDLMDNSGGLAKVICDYAGNGLDEECKNWVKRNGRIPAGEIAVTQAHNLSTRYKGIIHAVGPSGKETDIPTEDQESHLTGTILESFIAADKNCASIALTSISTGNFNYNKEYAAKNHLEAFIIFAGQYRVYRNNTGNLKDIKIVIFDDKVLNEFINKIVEKMDIFDVFEYTGTPLEISNGLIFSYCEHCERSFTLDWFYFSITNCSPHCCDFCIFDEDMNACCICKKPFQGKKNNAYIGRHYFCRRCKNQTDKNKTCSCPLETQDF